jgi:hypothetical protein
MQAPTNDQNRAAERAVDVTGTSSMQATIMLTMPATPTHREVHMSNTSMMI